MRIAKTVPKYLYRFFWDVTPKTVDLSKSAPFVIQRLLDKGNTQAVRWVRKNFTSTQIKEAFTKLRGFSPKVGNFWTIFLQIPKNQVLCLQTLYRKTRKTHWPY